MKMIESCFPTVKFGIYSILLVIVWKMIVYMTPERRVLRRSKIGACWLFPASMSLGLIGCSVDSALDYPPLDRDSLGVALTSHYSAADQVDGEGSFSHDIAGDGGSRILLNAPAEHIDVGVFDPSDISDMGIRRLSLDLEFMIEPESGFVRQVASDTNLRFIPSAADARTINGVALERYSKYGIQVELILVVSKIEGGGLELCLRVRYRFVRFLSGRTPSILDQNLPEDLAYDWEFQTSVIGDCESSTLMRTDARPIVSAAWSTKYCSLESIEDIFFDGSWADNIPKNIMLNDGSVEFVVYQGILTPRDAP